MFDLDWIRKLIDLLDESDVDSLEISRFGTRIVLSKSPPITARLSLADVDANHAAAPVPRTAATAAGHAGGVVASSEPTGSEPPADAPTEVDEGLVEINSPMVGTFYRAPAPDAPAYVEVGDLVKEGQTLCILEAMKLMNELESEVTGVVREISVQNSEPVEYGQVLFRIALDGKP